MNENDSDFLTYTQRAKFVRKIFPVMNVFVALIIAFTGTNKILCLSLGLLIPVIGVSSIKIGLRLKKVETFKILSAFLNLINFFFICFLSGPNSPMYLLGIVLIGVWTLLFSNMRSLIYAIITILVFMTLGSFLAGKTFQDIIISLAVLITYSIILVRFLQFTLLLGREVISANNEIDSQKKLIEEKNKDIIDSIKYARRIQSSLLPTEKFIDRILTNGNKNTFNTN